jgi:hypothetical protein
VDHRSNGPSGGGPRREPGSRVHSGPGQGVFPRLDQDRPCAIARPWWHASGKWRQARRDRERGGGASPARAWEGVPGSQINCGWVLRVAGELAHTSRGSERGFGRPQRPTPKGGGAGLAGVQAPVQRCVPETRNDGKRCSPCKDGSNTFTGEEGVVAAKFNVSGDLERHSGERILDLRQASGKRTCGKGRLHES